MGNKYLNLDFDEIIEMKKTMTYEEIAKKLNITKHILKYCTKRYCLENEIESLKRKIYKYDEEFFREIVDLKLRKK